VPTTTSATCGGCWKPALLVRLLRTEGLLWAEPKQVSQQALSERFRIFPAPLFLRVLLTVLPVMHARWRSRKRPLPADWRFGSF